MFSDIVNCPLEAKLPQLNKPCRAIINLLRQSVDKCHLSIASVSWRRAYVSTPLCI